MITSLLQYVCCDAIAATMEINLKNRDARVTVLYTAEERAEIAKAAEMAGLNLSSWIRLKTLEAARTTNA